MQRSLLPLAKVFLLLVAGLHMEASQRSGARIVDGQTSRTGRCVVAPWHLLRLAQPLVLVVLIAAVHIWY